MTGGSEKNGSGSNGTPVGGAGSTRHALPRDDRETLSALFDGELPSDAAKFALRRLDHDLQWREACGRWQLIGDALRGESIAIAPPNLASNVAHALGQLPSQETVATSSPPNAQPGPTASRRWMGGLAMAASVALAAVLVVRPFESAPQQDTPAVAAAPAGSPVVAPAAPAVAPGGDSNAPVMPAARVASVDPPRSQRSAAPRRRPSPVAARGEQRDLAVGAVAAAPEAASRRQPFHPPVEEITTRPWPRAVMAESTAVGAFTVGLETQSVPAASPFEPPAPAEPASGDTPP